MRAALALAVPITADDKRLLYARVETWRAPDLGPIAGYRFWADEMAQAVEHYEIAPDSGEPRLISAEEYREATVGFR